MFDVWCYYYILLYIHIIISIIIYYITISYLILYSSYHLSSSPLSNIPFLSSSHLSNLLIPFIQSIRVGSSISLFIFQTHPTIPIYLFQIRGVLVFRSDCKVFVSIFGNSGSGLCFERLKVDVVFGSGLVLTSGVILYYILYIYIYYILYITHILLYLILYYTLLFF